MVGEEDALWSHSEVTYILGESLISGTLMSGDCIDCSYHFLTGIIERAIEIGISIAELSRTSRTFRIWRVTHHRLSCGDAITWDLQSNAVVIWNRVPAKKLNIHLSKRWIVAGNYLTVKYTFDLGLYKQKLNSFFIFTINYVKIIMLFNWSPG